MADYTLEQLQAHFEERESIDDYISEQLEAMGYRLAWSPFEVDGERLTFTVDLGYGDRETESIDIKLIIGKTPEELREAKKKLDEQAKAAWQAIVQAERRRVRAKQIADARKLLAEVDGSS